jgi:hypothetical protein
MNLKGKGWGVMEWIEETQDRDQWKFLVNTIINLRVPKIIWKSLSNRGTGGS